MFAVCLNNPEHQRSSYLPISPNLLHNKTVSPRPYKNPETLQYFKGFFLISGYSFSDFQ